MTMHLFRSGICLSLLVGFILLRANGQSIDTSYIQVQLDSIIQDGIDSMAFPGAQVCVMINGKVVYINSYGHHTYDAKVEVENDHVYDLASVTKVTTGLPVIMQLYGERKLDLDVELKEVFPEFRKGDMSKRAIRDMLAHRAGLTPYIVFWKEMLDDKGRRRKNSFDFKYSEDYPVKITDRLFLHKDYYKKMYKSIRKADVDDPGQYRYSGLLFLLMPDFLKPHIGDDFEGYLYERLYVPMGLTHLTYRPRRRFTLDKIVPTEYDDFFRYQLVQGRVHDEAAAMLNGISCNAGLFGNAEDLARLFQMYVNGGTMDGKRYIAQSAIEEFTRYQFPEEGNRRGLGFDKPLLEYDQDLSYVARDASPSSFGHSGFTGTFVWGDPEYNMVFVFLSNRVYPTRDNRKLYTMNIRPKMHQVVYDAIKK
jgi:CubicO group peptidase (beta-lactamase class C family)